MDILTVEETARILKISPFTVRELLKAGELPGRKVGRQWRILQTDLQAFLSQKRDGVTLEGTGNSAIIDGTDVIAERDPYGTARLAEEVLARDWLTHEEDER